MHRVLLDAGLGPDVANSFLVLATAEENHLDAFADPTTIAWIMGGERRALWKRTQAVNARGSELRVTAQANSGGNESRSEHWLSQVPERTTRGTGDRRSSNSSFRPVTIATRSP